MTSTRNHRMEAALYAVEMVSPHRYREIGSRDLAISFHCRQMFSPIVAGGLRDIDMRPTTGVSPNGLIYVLQVLSQYRTPMDFCPGLATVEIVGFGGQTAPTTQFGSPNYTNYHILKTNCSTISALIVEQFYVPP